MRVFLPLVLMFVLTGCAMPLKSGELMPQYDFYDRIEETKYQDAVFVQNVTVSETVTGTFTIPAEEFRAALVMALRQADIYKKFDEAEYYLNAHMVGLDQPVFGFNMTSTATIEYSVHKKDNNDVVFKETMSLPCSKGMGDAFNGNVRARMANGCAVGENITHFIKVLSQS